MNQKFTDLPALLRFAAAQQKDKGYFQVGFLPEATAQLVASILQTANHQQFSLLLDSDSIRHTLAQHGIAKSILETARGQLPITDSDLLALPGWLLTPTAIRPGQLKPGKQPRIEFDYVESTATTTAILEWRPGRQQLALVTMYKKRPAA